MQFPPAFYRDDGGQPPDPPLARMLRGGQGGEVRLKLYLTMTMLAASGPYDIKSIPARAWAEVLALPDPGLNGARRVTEAINWLRDERLITTRQQPGVARDVKLLSPAGDGKGYYWRDQWYVGIPLGFWRNEWIYRLSGVAVAFLFVFRDMRGKSTPSSPPFLTTQQKKRYGFSEDSWTRATKELGNPDNGLLIVRRTPQGKEFDYRRLRNTYWLNIEHLDTGSAGPSTVPA